MTNNILVLPLFIYLLIFNSCTNGSPQMGERNYDSVDLIFSYNDQNPVTLSIKKGIRKIGVSQSVEYDNFQGFKFNKCKVFNNNVKTNGEVINYVQIEPGFVSPRGNSFSKSIDNKISYKEYSPPSWLNSTVEAYPPTKLTLNITFQPGGKQPDL